LRLLRGFFAIGRQLQYTLRIMRPVYFLAPFFALLAFSQDAKRPILSAHNRTDRPFGGETHVSDLRVFEDGEVIYVKEENNTLGAKPERSTYKATLPSEEIQLLQTLLATGEIRALPTKIPSKTRPIDFSWQKSIEINRSGKNQKIEIENFYPFLNLNEPAYPKALIALECRLQDIEAEVAKGSPPKAEDNWCKDLLGTKGAPSVEPAHAACREDAAQPTIVPDEGWGQVRIGAAATAIDALLGDGQTGHTYKGVYFKDYPPNGVQASFESLSNTVHAIYFYNGQHGDEQFAVFCGHTNNGINWKSSVDEVKSKYGHPTADYSGTDSRGTWQRLVFDGIDFRFENGRMVRIGIPGN
jgi:hypothetical protein